jgi:RNA recognition motif-containing protein
MTKLYIGNLPYQTTEDDLKTLFADYGTVLSATLITDRDSGRSKGFGFVELEDDAKAQEAITALDKSAYGERTIFVSVARPREERPQGAGFGGGSRGGFDRGGHGGRDDRRGGGGHGGGWNWYFCSGI